MTDRVVIPFGPEVLVPTADEFAQARARGREYALDGQAALSLRQRHPGRYCSTLRRWRGRQAYRLAGGWIKRASIAYPIGASAGSCASSWPRCSPAMPSRGGAYSDHLSAAGPQVPDSMDPKERVSARVSTLTARLPHYADRCRCTMTTDGCGEYFNSTAAFDKHRTGQQGVDRRCLTEAEMCAAGMARNSGGYWITRPMSGPRMAAVARPAPAGAAIVTDPLPRHGFGAVPSGRAG